MVNKKFRFTITLQFIISTLVVCVTLYQLTKTNAKIIQLGLYMSCMLTQIFLYCWYGNEVRLKVIMLLKSINLAWFFYFVQKKLNILHYFLYILIMQTFYFLNIIQMKYLNDKHVIITLLMCKISLSFFKNTYSDI